MPHDRERLAGRDMEREILKNEQGLGDGRWEMGVGNGRLANPHLPSPISCSVAELHVLKGNLAVQSPNRLIRGLDDMWRCVDQGKHSLAGGQSLLKLPPEG